MDITLPGKKPVLGRKHPLTITLDGIIRDLLLASASRWRRDPDVELGLLQFRSPQHAQGPPGPGHAGYLLCEARGRAADPDLAGPDKDHGAGKAAHSGHCPGVRVPARPGHLPHAHVPPGGRPHGRQERPILRSQGNPHDIRQRDVRRERPRPVPAQLLPLYRAIRRKSISAASFAGARLRRLQEDRLARNPRVREASTPKFSGMSDTIPMR